MHTPVGPGLAHRMILALSKCPVGSYANGAELRICVVPGEKLVRVINVEQPFLFVNSDDVRGRNVPVVVSVTIKAMRSKSATPVLVTSNSSHQPRLGQLSIPL